MDRKNLPGLDEPLTEAEYDRLAAVLDANASPSAMDLEEMDGFFAALICGPVVVPPSVYLSEIWGGENDSPFATVVDLDEFLNLAMRHWNFVARTLASPDLIFLPCLTCDAAEEIPKGNRWAQGFVRGMNLRRDGWHPLFEDEEKFGMLLPILALAHENDPDPEMRTWVTPPDAELRDKVLAGLSVAAQALYDEFRSRPAAGPRHTAVGTRRPAPKIGRNDPCPCGSGEKYKRCCGSGGATVH